MPRQQEVTMETLTIPKYWMPQLKKQRKQKLVEVRPKVMVVQGHQNNFHHFEIECYCSSKVRTVIIMLTFTSSSVCFCWKVATHGHMEGFTQDTALVSLCGGRLYMEGRAVMNRTLPKKILPHSLWIRQKDRSCRSSGFHNHPDHMRSSTTFPLLIKKNCLFSA